MALNWKRWGVSRRLRIIWKKIASVLVVGRLNVVPNEF
jgi:hypothetical protein